MSSKDEHFKRLTIGMIQHLHKSGSLTNKAAVYMLLTMNPHRDSDGKLYCFMPRDEISNLLGLKDSSVRRAITNLIKDDKVLSIRTLGRVGNCTEYYIL